MAAEDTVRLSFAQSKALKALDKEIRDLFLERDTLVAEIVEVHGKPPETRLEIVDLAKGLVRFQEAPAKE